MEVLGVSEPWTRCLHGNVAAVADFFGKDRKQVHRWLTEYEIDREEYR